MELTKNNYLFGTGHGDTWHVNIDPPTRKVKTYFEETLDAVEYVYANKTGKFQVLYSGGLGRYSSRNWGHCTITIYFTRPRNYIISIIIW